MMVDKWYVAPGFRKFGGGVDQIKWKPKPWGVEAEITSATENPDPTKLPQFKIDHANIPWQVLAQMLMTRDRDV